MLKNFPADLFSNCMLINPCFLPTDLPVCIYCRFPELCIEGYELVVVKDVRVLN
jgi:hypothetical protein